MESVKVDENCKKNLIAPYQQSFRIDDLLTRKVIDQQPGLLPHHNHHHYHHHHSSITALQSPPVGMISSHHHHHPHHNLEKPPPPIDISATSGGGSSGSQRAGYANGKGLNGKSNETSNCEENCKDVTKRSYSSTSNEEDDDLYQKRKKPRTAFSREQVADLEKKFQEKKYLSSAERGELAEKLKLSDMQVKTWFQNRRMKYKRQSEEAEMEIKSPKYPYSPFMSYSGVSPFYSYVPMPYKPHDGPGGTITPYNYSGTASLRSPQTTTSPISGGGGGMEANFVMNSPTMLGSLSSPLSAGVSPRHHGLHTPLPRPNGGTSYFNGLLTPISPSTSYQHGYFTNESALSGHHTQVHGFSDWPRVVPTPTSP